MLRIEYKEDNYDKEKIIYESDFNETSTVWRLFSVFKRFALSLGYTEAMLKKILFEDFEDMDS